MFVSWLTLYSKMASLLDMLQTKSCAVSFKQTNKTLWLLKQSIANLLKGAQHLFSGVEW